MLKVAHGTMESYSTESPNCCCFCDKNLLPNINKGTTNGQSIQQSPIRQSNKYKCPGCERLYCSADCFAGHKEKFQCTGVRNKIPYVHMKNFDQKQFLDDYFFLEEVNNKIEDAHRLLPVSRRKLNPVSQTTSSDRSGATGSKNAKKRRHNKRVAKSRFNNHQNQSGNQQATISKDSQ